MKTIFPFAKIEAIFFILLFGYCIYDAPSISFLLRIGFIAMIICGLYVLSVSYRFNEEYLEKSFLWKKTRIPLAHITCVKKTFHVGVYHILSDYPKAYYFSIDFSLQNRKKNLLFGYIKQSNPDCKFY